MQEEPTIPAEYARLIAEQLRTMGVSVEEWLEQNETPESDLEDAAGPLPYAQFRRLAVTALAAAREPALGLFVGERLVASTHGVVGAAAVNSSTVRQALDMVERFARLRSSVVTITHEIGPREGRVIFTEGVPLGDAQRPLLEALVLSVKNVLDEITMGACQVRSVAFPFPAPGYAALAEDMFGCKVRYGTLRSFGYDAPKPDEFGSAGRNWSDIGYRADVDYVRLTHPVAPREIWDQVRPLLPEKYSPLNPANGRGLQSVYLAALPPALGDVLWQAVAAHGNPLQTADTRGLLIASAEEPERETWERQKLKELEETRLDSTEREALIKARRGQGLFRRNVAHVEQACRITRVTNPTYLIASHIKPWRHAENDERLSGHNGLMLAPQADFLFDRGFISFGEGRLLISPRADEKTLVKLGVDPDRPPDVGRFSPDQERFLEFHRAEIFRSASPAVRRA